MYLVGECGCFKLVCVLAQDCLECGTWTPVGRSNEQWWPLIVIVILFKKWFFNTVCCMDNTCVCLSVCVYLLMGFVRHWLLNVTLCGCIWCCNWMQCTACVCVAREIITAAFGVCAGKRQHCWMERHSRSFLMPMTATVYGILDDLTIRTLIDEGCYVTL